LDKIDNNARRSVLRAGALAGAALGLGSLIRDDQAYAAGKSNITEGDIAILQFLLVAEAVETDAVPSSEVLSENASRGMQ